MDARVDPDAAAPGPSPPESPRLTPCPQGWTEVAGDIVVCDAFAGGGPRDCPPGEAQFPGDADCRALGAECPVGDFAAGLEAPGGTVWYVSAGAAAGGTGTIGDPFATIGAALAEADAGDVVALSRGIFPESVDLPDGLTLVGACAGETRLEAPTSAGAAGVITVSGADVVVRDLALSGPRPGLWIEGRGRSAHLVGVEIADVELSGLLVADGAELSGSSVAIRDVRARAVPGVSGFGVLVDTRGWLELDHVAIERTAGTAVMAFGTHVALADAAIRDLEGTQPQAHGIEAQGGADIALRRAWIGGMLDVAVIGFDLLTNLILEDVVVRATAPRADGFGGRGIALHGAVATVRRALLEDLREVAVIGDEIGGSVLLEDVVIRRVDGRAVDGRGGSAIAMQGGANATLTRVDVAESRGVGVIVFGLSAATLTDVAIRETRGLSADGDQGSGLQAQDGATVDGIRLAIARARQAGIIAIQRGTVVLEDAAVDDTRARDCATDTCAGRGFGDGILAAEDGVIELTRFRVRNSARVGVMVGGGTIDLHHGEVSGHPIGASIQIETFDQARLFDDVLFRDNDRNLDRSALPLPEPGVQF